VKNSFLGSRKVFTEFRAQVAADLITGSSPAGLLPAGTERATVTEIPFHGHQTSNVPVKSDFYEMVADCQSPFSLLGMSAICSSTGPSA
jgi:hypothetical protein